MVINQYAVVKIFPLPPLMWSYCLHVKNMQMYLFIMFTSWINKTPPTISILQFCLYPFPLLWSYQIIYLFHSCKFHYIFLANMFMTCYERILVPAQSLLKDLHTEFQCKLDPQLLHQGRLHWEKDKKIMFNPHSTDLAGLHLVSG